jgi:hypothetical protein
VPYFTPKTVIVNHGISGICFGRKKWGAPHSAASWLTVINISGLLRPIGHQAHKLISPPIGLTAIKTSHGFGPEMFSREFCFADATCRNVRRGHGKIRHGHEGFYDGFLAVFSKPAFCPVFEISSKKGGNPTRRP